jgi:hypothetical protein
VRLRGALVFADLASKGTVILMKLYHTPRRFWMTEAPIRPRNASLTVKIARDILVCFEHRLIFTPIFSGLKFI